MRASWSQITAKHAPKNEHETHVVFGLQVELKEGMKANNEVDIKCPIRLVVESLWTETKQEPGVSETYSAPSLCRAQKEQYIIVDVAPVKHVHRHSSIGALRCQSDSKQFAYMTFRSAFWCIWGGSAGHAKHQKTRASGLFHKSVQRCGTHNVLET